MGTTNASKHEMPIMIGKRPIGMGLSPYLVAEIGINHNGDMDLAKKTVDAAKAAGADAVKFQNYRTEDFLTQNSQVTHSYVSQGKKVVELQYEMFKRYELDEAGLRDIARHCEQMEIDFHSTPTNSAGVALLQELGAAVLKNGSDYLTNTPLVEAMADTGLPTVLSTGMATVSEIDRAVRAFRGRGNSQLILLHCVSQYPAPYDELNLRRISTLADLFDCPIGYSDHAEGGLASAMSVSFGSCWIEKHFTMDKSLPGPDHAMSSDASEFASMVTLVKQAEQSLGRSDLGHISARENESRQVFRLSCAAARDLAADSVLTIEDIGFYRPGGGYPPEMRELIIGRRLTRDISAGEVYSNDHFL